MFSSIYYKVGSSANWIDREGHEIGLQFTRFCVGSNVDLCPNSQVFQQAFDGTDLSISFRRILLLLEAPSPAAMRGSCGMEEICHLASCPVGEVLVLGVEFHETRSIQVQCFLQTIKDVELS